MTRRRTPRVHFSFRSPFSWMALSELYRRMPDADEVLEFVPFWDPDEQTAAALADRGAEIPYTPMSKAKHLYILQDTRRQAARLGLSMTWPVDDDPWWELPHLAWLRARRLGVARRFYEAVVEARWEHGRDVCERPVLREAAAAAGLDPEPLLSAPESADIRRESVDCLERAFEDDIFGIPYFRVGRHRFWGLDRLDGFLAELAVPGPPAPPEPAVPVGAYDTDTAGGCG
ncbi:disulfide bond formation protein DsbA [Amycolatopsis rubida]|uniref:2-hydroxychromene-2-carboxylate isomerase n=2 Tax=Amycolatopsis TaxID=1813 RepID=A0A1I5SAM9_9PSEU|nr:DsbA family protein [Amycolatopsis rubida]MYW89294.1 disulfide bond formation protein DsbA [Amycolatopsis rubida]NEC54272.1 disulfide bond formation protein DsbA [Amycolatopsis rubida]SFP67770.1 2-hydroxychromene-2-carboxylate isomerase [Amycolatopsis rubida]